MSIRKGEVIVAGRSSSDNDNVTITKSSSGMDQAIGVIDKNKSNVIYDWIGTLAEYNSQKVATIHPDWLCFIIDDFVSVEYATKTDLANKANTNADNFTAIGKALLTNFGFPSNRSRGFGKPANGAEFIAPADGYFVASLKADHSDCYVSLTSGAISTISNTPFVNANVECYIPVRKGATAVMWSKGILNNVNFVYAEGEK